MAEQRGDHGHGGDGHGGDGHGAGHDDGTAATESLVCIGCPVGCPLQLEHRGNEILEVSGNECSRGAKYARQEFTDPRRALSTTVAVRGARWARLPVKTLQPVPKDRVLEAAAAIHRLRVEAPIALGQVLAEDLLGEPGNHVVATRHLPRSTG